MDIRTYFKGDDNTSPPLKPPPPLPKSPPRPALLELPDFLFISAGSGIKRSRSTVPENVDDVDTTDNFDYHARRVLSPLEVRAIPTIPKPANENTHSTTNTTTTKRKKSKSTKDDGFFFSDDMDEKLAMFAAHKEKLKKQKEAETNTNNKNKLKPAKEPEKTAEQTTTPINSKNNKPLVKPTTLVPTPITPPPKATPQPSFYQAVPSTAPPISRPKKKVDVELENKIRDKMAAVQLWQTKCGELRKQLAHATAELTQSLDELDHLNSLYEESNS